MKLKLTNGQKKLIENRLEENKLEEKELRIRDKENEHVSGWSFVALSNERGDLEDILKNGYVQL